MRTPTLVLCTSLFGIALTAASCSDDATETDTSSSSTTTVSSSSTSGMIASTSTTGTSSSSSSSSSGTSSSSSSSSGAGGSGGSGGSGGANGTGGAGGGNTVKVLDETFTNDAGFEKFDGDDLAATFFSAGNSDFFGISNGTDDGDFDGDTAPDLTGLYAGFNGRFLAGQDIDDVNGDFFGALPAMLIWSDLDVAGLVDLEFSGLFAEIASDDTDLDDFIRVETIFDAGGAKTILEFRGSATNTEFKEDTNFDGTGDGKALTATAAAFTTSIADTGDKLTLRITLRVNANGEDFAFDDIKIVGTVN